MTLTSLPISHGRILVLLALISTMVFIFVTLSPKETILQTSTITTTTKTLSTVTTLTPPQPPPTPLLLRNLSLPTPSSTAIAVLVPHTESDHVDFCYALQSLTRFQSIPTNTPILVFHEPRYPSAFRRKIESCTPNPVTFHLVAFALPTLDERDDGIGIDYSDPRKREEGWYKKRVASMGENLGRKKWGYAHMIQFWTTLLWKHPIIQQYDVIMRIDTDSCFTTKGRALDSHLPSMPSDLVYRANSRGVGSNVWVGGLYDFAVNYVNDNHIIPSNPELWRFITDTWREMRTLPVFQTNFEVDRVAFFKRYDVMRWHEALTERRPHGVFRYRWGDAQTRVFTMAMFAKKEEVSYVRHPGYVHGRELCKEYF